MEKKNKKEVKKIISEFFRDIKSKKPEEVKKIKKLAMHHNIKLGKLRKKFCKKCYTPYIPGKTCKVRVKGGEKIVTCLNCGYVARWKIK